MTTFKMYVKTVIYDDQDKILLLNEKREDNKPCWDLPGASFTEEQSFDETIINNVQKEIGYYVYPGKIIGIADYTNKEEKEVDVIMEGTILNGDLLLSKDYETYTWVLMDRITDYPLAPWLNDYIKNNKNPFKDVETEIEEITNKSQRRRGFIQEDIRNNFSSRNNNDKNEKRSGNVKSSFGLLKDAIVRTFHPQQAKVTKTQPKANQIYQENTDVETEENEGIADKLNINFRRKKEEEYIDKDLLKDTESDIIIEHDDDIVIEHDDNTISENDEESILLKPAEPAEPIVKKLPKKEENKTPRDNIQKFISNNKKVFDMNINRTQNMRENVNKISRAIREKKPKELEIKIIHKNEETPRIRTEKESKGRVSFNSENIKRTGWKEQLNRINRTEANNQRKEAPRPKGQRK